METSLSSSPWSALVTLGRPLSMPSLSLKSRSTMLSRSFQDWEFQCLEFSLAIFLESSHHSVFWETGSWILKPLGSQKSPPFPLAWKNLCLYPALLPSPLLTHISSQYPFIELRLTNAGKEALFENLLFLTLLSYRRWVLLLNSTRSKLPLAKSWNTKHFNVLIKNYF